MAANTLIMHNSDQITFQLSYFQDQKLLMLYWYSIKCIVHYKTAAIDNCIYNELNLLIAILTDSDSAVWQSRAQWYSYTVRSNSNKINVSC